MNETGRPVMPGFREVRVTPFLQGKDTTAAPRLFFPVFLLFQGIMGMARTGIFACLSTRFTVLPRMISSMGL